MPATSTTTATPPAAATADCLNAVRRWCRCSRSRTSPRSSTARPPISARFVRKSRLSRKIPEISQTSFRVAPSAPDFRALPRAFSCRFPYLCQTKLMNNEQDETLQTIPVPADDAIGNDIYKSTEHRSEVFHLFKTAEGTD